MYQGHKDFEMVWPDPPSAKGEPVFVVTSLEGIEILQPEEFVKYLDKRADNCCAPGDDMGEDHIFVKLPADREIIPVKFTWGKARQIGDDEQTFGTAMDIEVSIVPEGTIVHKGTVFVPDH